MKNPIKNVQLWDVIWEFAVIGFLKKRKKKKDLLCLIDNL